MLATLIILGLLAVYVLRGVLRVRKAVLSANPRHYSPEAILSRAEGRCRMFLEEHHD